MNVDKSDNIVYLTDKDIENYLIQCNELHEQIKSMRDTCKILTEEIKQRNGGLFPTLMFMGVKFPLKN